MMRLPRARRRCGARRFRISALVAIFALIFWRIPIRKVEDALSQVPIIDFLAVFMPYSLFYCALDSACLTWVVRRFNAPMHYRDILPICASMYVLALIQTPASRRAASRIICIARPGSAS